MNNKIATVAGFIIGSTVVSVITTPMIIAVRRKIMGRDLRQGIIDTLNNESTKTQD